MINKNIKQNNGITLIALVITIIVLLILAGVAIAMLSGENGILKKAAESKTKTEEGQKEEMSSLLSYEMVLKADSEYKYQHGYVTGFEYNKENKKTISSVKDLENALPDGYKVSTKYKYSISTRTGEDEVIDEEQKEEMGIATGMTITKDGQEVARTVLFGDIDCNGVINSLDYSCIKRYDRFYSNENEFNEFQKMAMNVCNDKEINSEDDFIFKNFALGEININQKEIKKFPGKDLSRFYTELQEYIKSLDISSGYSFEYNSEQDSYKLKGVKNDTTVETLINALPTSKEVTIIDKDRKGLSNDSKVVDGGYVQIKFQNNGNEILSDFACIELEK